jgi:hypothetical protein
MMKASTFMGALGIAFVASGGPASAQMALPDGPNQALVTRTCSACHDLGMVLGAAAKLALCFVMVGFFVTAYLWK